MREGKDLRYLIASLKRLEERGRRISNEAAGAKRTDDKAEIQVNGRGVKQATNEQWNPEEREHHRQERSYWRWTLFVTFLAALGAVATVVLSTCSLNESRLATAAVSQQAKIASQTLVESNRPWVAVTGITTDYLDITKDEVRLTVNVEFQNVGHSPAQQLDVSGKLIPFTASLNLEEQRKFCAGEQSQRKSKIVEDVVFPETGSQRRRLVETIKPSELINNSKRLFASVAESVAPQLGGTISNIGPVNAALVHLQLIGCITYVTTVDSFAKVHSSSFAFTIMRQPRGSPTIQGLDYFIDVSVPQKLTADDLRGEQSNTGNFAD